MRWSSSSHFYCLASLIGLFVASTLVGTMLGVMFGSLAYAVERTGFMLFPTTLEFGGWRAFLGGAGLAYQENVIR
ncbi:MAG: hypothetical protein JO347_06300 [Candidatus Eremiobacteraeota bacterium]|nr:hypothetical protein [Candidatus Eremiobacteraeota bacterium]